MNIKLLVFGSYKLKVIAKLVVEREKYQIKNIQFYIYMDILILPSLHPTFEICRDSFSHILFKDLIDLKYDELM